MSQRTLTSCGYLLAFDWAISEVHEYLPFHVYFAPCAQHWCRICHYDVMVEVQTRGSFVINIFASCAVHHCNVILSVQVCSKLFFIHPFSVVEDLPYLLEHFASNSKHCHYVSFSKQRIWCSVKEVSYM